jgi:Uma2 family endonuclease
MSTVAEMVVKVEVPDFPPDELLISEDGVPLESDWHRIEIGLLVELVGQNFAGRNDYFAGGNMFIYFNEEQARNKDFRGPDFFFVWGASPMPLRPHWTIWKEGGRYPNVIIELMSSSTAEVDLTTKKDVYERIFRTPEYFCYDPETSQFAGWRLEHGKYEPLVRNEKGWLWSEQLQLWLGVWNGWYLNRETAWLRFFHRDGNLVLTVEEAGKEKAALAEQKAASAEQEAEEQRRRADAAEAELALLKAQLSTKKD